MPIDIDHFKPHNDEHGYLAGDLALQTVAGAIGIGMREPGDNAAALISRADAALYPTKEGGRHRTSL